MCDHSRRVVLALMAHPDDAEFLCVGALSLLADIGWEVHIAAMTPGDCGSSSLSREAIASVRRAEGTDAAALIGASFHCLEECDVNVIYNERANRKVIDLMRQISPSLVFTHPRRDYMIDHEQTHVLARNATFAYPIPNASTLPLPDGAKVPHLYYCDPIDAVDPYSGELAVPSVYVNTTSVIDRKSAALARHASQREWLLVHHGMDEYTEVMLRHSRQRGAEVGWDHAEAFAQHRGHAYPQSDILREELQEFTQCPVL
ncbi:MAG TPA: PIG-L family deacetylase [Lacipirellulaceae bacterium]|nr:PIG-L family deacetylase [Lacipirellulaceae bacterium]